MGKGSEDMTFAKDLKKMEDPKEFIGNTSATCDTNNSKCGFKNIRESTSKNNITDALGRGIEGRIVDNLSVIICNKNVQEVKDVTIKDIVHMSNAGYNLFILTFRMN